MMLFGGGPYTSQVAQIKVRLGSWAWGRRRQSNKPAKDTHMAVNYVTLAVLEETQNQHSFLLEKRPLHAARLVLLTDGHSCPSPLLLPCLAVSSEAPK